MCLILVFKEGELMSGSSWKHLRKQKMVNVVIQQVRQSLGLMACMKHSIMLVSSASIILVYSPASH